MNNRSQFSFSEGAINERCVEYYKERCRGAAGLIITGVFKVEDEIEKELWPILTEYGATRLAEIADYAHSYGAKVIIQLSAGAGRNIRGVKKPVCASPVPAFYWPEVTCRELTTEEVDQIIEAFGKAATIATAAGLDGIEVHGHEGYLLDSFTSSFINKRTDKYGGDLKGRLRFSIEILKKIRSVVGQDFPVIYRYAIRHFIKNFGEGALERKDEEAGRDVPEGLEVAKMLQAAGYDALDIDAGCYESFYWAHPPIYQPHGCYVDLVKDVKKYVQVPIILAGRLGIPQLANQVIEEGKTDIVALGRDLLADPYWPAKVKVGKIQSIRPCIACHKGCLERARTRTLSCSVNPSCGREIFHELKKVERIKKVLIAGGGLAGMEAARVAALRGHDVSLFEKSNHLGGHLIAASVPAFKQDVKRLLDWYQYQLNELNVKINLKIEVDPTIVKEFKPNIVIIATGSIPKMPKIKGIPNPKVVTCIDLLLEKAKPAKQIVVVGGGLVGCESALWLAEKGSKVTIVEMLPEVALDFFTANRNMLLELLAKNKVEILTNTSVQEIADDKVMAVDKKFNQYVLPYDQVALATGQKPRKELYECLIKEFPEVYEIGDCFEPRNIHFAIWDGYAVGCLI
jgi:2-enoate reductase